jgi:hypothetical protein
MNLRYKFWLPQQLLVGVIPFASAVGIPYLVGDPIDWLMVGTGTVSVFLASGVRFCRRDCTDEPRTLSTSQVKNG